MKNNLLWKTNLFVLVIIILGFAMTSIISYRSNIGVFEQDVEKVTILTSEGIYYQIESTFMQPVRVSQTMANDTLLKELLAAETEHLEDSGYALRVKTYLDSYREKYGYDSVFLVSTRSNRYYHYDGIDRILTADNPENVWYYSFLQDGSDYSLNIDNDEARGKRNEITVFVNSRITDETGNTVGVVGVGFDVTSLQALLKSYGDRFSLNACLVNQQGVIEVSGEQTGYENVNLFDICDYPELRDQLLRPSGRAPLWHNSKAGRMFVGSRYLSELSWYLIVENNTSAQIRQFHRRLAEGAAVIALVITSVTLAITYVFRKYNERIIALTRSVEQERKTVFQAATEQLFERICELDITNNRVASSSTEQYFESFGVPAGTPYDEALGIIAQNQIKEEYRQGYIDTFSRENVLRALREGRDSLTYEFLNVNGKGGYYWIRISARIVHWTPDNSLHLLSYRQNIDAEKRQEHRILEQMQQDSMTGLYDKAATQSHIKELLETRPDGPFAFFIIDIDDFKSVNDRFGHAAGDRVIQSFARTLKSSFREDDLVGRVGGDEFAVFLPTPDRRAAEKKARELSAALHMSVPVDGRTCQVSASIGIALAPGDGGDFESLYKRADSALYRTKQDGKNGFAFWEG